MADDFNSWGGAGAGAGAWAGVVRRAARGLNKLMGDGMPASQQMRDWYQQYAAEHGQNRNALVDARNAAAAISRQNRENQPQPPMTYGEPWADPNYKSPFEQQLNRVISWFNDGPAMPGYGAIYRSPGNMRAMSTGQKGLRDVPAEGQQAQQPWTYKANPYTEEQIQNMYKNGQFMYSGGYWGTDNDTGQPVWNPPLYNVNIWGSGSPYSDQPHYLGGMNTVVQAMNNINNGYDLPSGYYQNVIDRYKADPSLLTSQADQIDRMIEQARQELASGGRTQWANTILDTYLPQQQAYRQMVDQFSNAFQQWQPNPGGGTSWQQTATPWQGAAQYLEQMQQPVATPVQVSPEPQKHAHVVAPQQAAPQPAAAPAGYGGINPNVLAAIRRGQGQ